MTAWLFDKEVIVAAAPPTEIEVPPGTRFRLAPVMVTEAPAATATGANDAIAGLNIVMF
jgi:hypothetical protein